MVRRHRPLFPPLRPRRNQYAPMSSEQAPYHSLRRKRQSSLIPLLLLFQPNPLRWASSGQGKETKDRASDHSTRLTVNGKADLFHNSSAPDKPASMAFVWIGETVPSFFHGKREKEKITTIVLRGFSLAGGQREYFTRRGGQPRRNENKREIRPSQGRDSPRRRSLQSRTSSADPCGDGRYGHPGRRRQWHRPHPCPQ